MGWLQPLRAAQALSPHAVRRLQATPPRLNEGLRIRSWTACVACRAFASGPSYTPSPPRLGSCVLPASSSSLYNSSSFSTLSSSSSSPLLHPLSSSHRQHLRPANRRLPLLTARPRARFCSAMCRSRAGLEAASSASVQGRELLPANVVPRHYHLTVEPDFEKLTYDGTVVIDLDVAEESSSISLHTLELDIHSAKLSSGGQAVR